MQYSDTHPMAVLTKALPLKDGDDMPGTQFFDAVKNLMRMWEALDAKSRRDGECKRCERVAAMFEPPDRKVTADEVIDFILDREKSQDIQGLPAATDKDTGVIKGVVKYKGKNPPRRPIRMDQDQFCAKFHPADKPQLSQVWVFAKDGSVDADLRQVLSGLRQDGVRAKDAVAQVSEATGLAKNRVYQVWVELGRESG